MRGRTPRPANLAKLSGDRRALKRKTLDLPFAIPCAPMWLTPEAKNEWDEIVPVLARMRVISDADKIAIALLADALARWKYLTEQIKIHGYVHEILGRNGLVERVVRSPHITMHIEYGQIVQKMLIQFGLTPSARARITSNEQKEKDFTFSRIDAEQN